jgi:argininosuccinate synthase
MALNKKTVNKNRDSVRKNKKKKINTNKIKCYEPLRISIFSRKNKINYYALTSFLTKVNVYVKYAYEIFKNY